MSPVDNVLGPVGYAINPHDHEGNVLMRPVEYAKNPGVSGRVRNEP
jgi:hypothetical protein